MFGNRHTRPDYESSVSKHTKSKDASNKQKIKLKTNPKPDTESTNTDHEAIESKLTNMEDANNDTITNKVQNLTKIRQSRNTTTPELGSEEKKV